MKQKLLKCMLLLCILVGGVSSAWGDEETYTFTSKSWGAKNSANQTADWTSGKDGGQLTSGQGIQVTTGASGANGTSPVSFDDISEIVVTYCTNASKGEGTIKVQVGEGDEKSFSVTKPSSGGTTLKTATFTYVPTETGNVKVTVNCTTNSIYIYSVKITYTPSGGGGSDPSISASNANIAQDATNGSIGYTLSNATGNVTAATTSDWLTLGEITSSAVPFTCSANTGAERTAQVTLSFTGADDKIVTVTQAAKTVEKPTFNPEGGSYMQGTNITISSAGNTVYYNMTTDGSTPATPTNASTEYSAPIVLGSGTTKITAIAYDTYGNVSSVITRTYTGIATATLPFSWTGTSSAGKAQLGQETGVVANLGSDYAASNAPYRLKFDGTSKYVIIYTDVKPEVVYFTAKLFNAASTGSKIKVQGSADGITFTDIEEFTIKGAANDTFGFTTSNAFESTHRAVKLVMSSKDQNVAVGTICINCVPVTLNASGYATYASTYPLDFTNSNIKAYIATSPNGSSVNLSEVNKVPANTGVVLNYSGEITENIPVFDGTSADDVAGNCLLVSDGTVKGGTGIYALANKNHGIGFYQVNNSVTIPKGKAYLQTGANTKEFLNFDFSDDETGINTVNGSELMVNGSIFNLSGQRISKLQKGVNIVNGKKVLF